MDGGWTEEGGAADSGRDRSGIGDGDGDGSGTGAERGWSGAERRAAEERSGTDRDSASPLGPSPRGTN